jgi:hypothetical protein
MPALPVKFIDRQSNTIYLPLWGHGIPARRLLLQSSSRSSFSAACQGFLPDFAHICENSAFRIFAGNRRQETP